MQAVTPRSLDELRRRREGQALILGALAMFLLALVLMATLNVGQTVHEKIALQQHADSMAYSMAVLEARAFNYFAVSNRAMAATHVALTSLHGGMAIASATPAVFSAGMVAFIAAAAFEFIFHCRPGPTAIVHCVIHPAKWIMTAMKYNKERKTWLNKVKDLETTFRMASQALGLMIDSLFASQLALLASTNNMLRGAGLEKLREVNAPRASKPSTAVALLSMHELGCAVEGTSLALCERAGLSKPNLGKTMADVANATRMKGVAKIGKLAFVHPLWWAKYRSLSSGHPIVIGPLPINTKGSAKVVHSASTGDLHGGGHYDGNAVGADYHGYVAFLHIGAHPMPLVLPGLTLPQLDAKIFSDRNQGQHSPGGAHTGSHRYAGTCTSEARCFLNFRISDKRTEDYGQPSVYVLVSQKLKEDRSTKGSGETKPWQINSTGKVSFKQGNQTGSVRLAPDEGAAMSKALVYYHRLADWSDQPNMFNPYWRAKLHPFSRLEAAAVATAGGWGGSAAAIALMVPE